MTANEYANSILLARLQQILNDPRQPKEVHSAIAQLVISAAVPFPLHHTVGNLCKFALGEPIKHVKSEHEYVVTALPIDNYLEATAQLCYAYIGMDGITWHRSQEEMEDGRFVSLYEPLPLGRFGGPRGFGPANTLT